MKTQPISSSFLIKSLCFTKLQVLQLCEYSGSSRLLTRCRYQAGYFLTPLPSRLESSSQGILQDTLATYHRLASRCTSSSFANLQPFLELGYTSLIMLRGLGRWFILTASTNNQIPSLKPNSL